jgi:hypothetical protein
MPQIIKIRGGRPKATPPREFMGFKLSPNDQYNGKPLEHWLAMADELVMHAIVRGINPDRLSLVQTVAAERLKHLAQALSPALYQKTIEERDRMRKNLPRLVAHILGHDGTPLCAKHARKIKKAKPRKRK